MEAGRLVSFSGNGARLLGLASNERPLRTAQYLPPSFISFFFFFFFFFFDSTGNLAKVSGTSESKLQNKPHARVEPSTFVIRITESREGHF